MKTYKIYTAGKMGGLPLYQQMEWRMKLEQLVKTQTNEIVQFIHPPMFYTYGGNKHKTDDEVREWDLAQVRDSDIVVFDLSTISSSIGTIMELATVAAMNQFGNKHIFAVGVGKPDTDHPWIGSCLIRQEDTLEDAARFILDYLLV